MTLAAIDSNVALFGILILVFALSLFAFCIYGIWLNGLPDAKSPYSHLPMRYGRDLSYYSSMAVLRYLYNRLEYNNRIFDLRKAAVCRETGRIFPNVMTWYGKIKLDWTFLQKKYPGNYVSWGSLTDDQQANILNVHDNLENFQFKYSSSLPQPKAVEAKYAFMSPGPLYVDIETQVLLGWVNVPDTDLEVLIVQKPVNQINLTVS